MGGLQRFHHTEDFVRFVRVVLQFVFERFEPLSNQVALHPLVRSNFAPT